MATKQPPRAYSATCCLCGDTLAAPPGGSFEAEKPQRCWPGCGENWVSADAAQQQPRRRGPVLPVTRYVDAESLEEYEDDGSQVGPDE